MLERTTHFHMLEIKEEYYHKEFSFKELIVMNKVEKCGLNYETNTLHDKCKQRNRV